MYFDVLGYRDTIKDAEQIMWFFKQTAKSKTKAHATKYWLDLKERYSEKLIKQEAYELLNLINEYATAAKIKRRNAFREKAKKEAELEMQNFNKWYDQVKIRSELIKLIRLN